MREEISALMSRAEVLCENTEGKTSGMSLIFVLSGGKCTRSLNKKINRVGGNF